MLNTNFNDIYLNNTNYYIPSFNGKTKDISNPAQTTQNTQANIIKKDEFISEKDKNKLKKSTKRAITLGSTFVGLSLAVMLLNPKYSPKLTKKLKNASLNMTKKMKENKDKIIASKFYEKMADFYNWSNKAFISINNINSVKDTYFMKLCCEEKSFLNVRNKQKRNILKKADSIFRKILKKPHELITKWGDKLAISTVKNSYKKSLSKADDLDKLIAQYKNKLSVDDQILLDNMLYKVKQNKDFMSEEKIIKRLLEQDKCMSSINSDIRTHYEKFAHGFRNHHVNNISHFNDNLSFWAEDRLKLDKSRILKNGNEFVDKLLGKNTEEKNGYKDVLEFLSKKINNDEMSKLNKKYDKLEKQLLKANKNECSEYFDKKRDLKLGSAPTDILSGCALLGLCGIKISTTDDKDKKMSILIKDAFPILSGFIVSVAMTTLLYSGVQGLLIGAASSVVLGKVASIIDNIRLKAKGKDLKEIEEGE